MTSPATMLLKTPEQNELYDTMVEYSFGDTLSLLAMAVENGLMPYDDVDSMCSMSFELVCTKIAHMIAKKGN